MTEYKTFDDYVRCIFKIEPTELTHISPEEQKKKTVKITADELINIWNELSELEKEVELWKKASENNSYKAFQLQEEKKTLSTHIVELQNDKGDLTDRCRELEAQIEKIKCLNEEIIKALKECPDSAWLVAHNGRTRYVYLQSVIDIVNEKFEDIKEK